MLALMQVHAFVAFGPASNTLARLNWFANIKYVIGGQQYSSNDIEHGVLRSNKPSPANILSLLGLAKIAPKTFKQGDPRMSQVVAEHPLQACSKVLHMHWVFCTPCMTLRVGCSN